MPASTLHLNKDFSSETAVRIFLSKHRKRLAGYTWVIRPLPMTFGNREQRYEAIGTQTAPEAQVVER